MAQHRERPTSSVQAEAHRSVDMQMRTLEHPSTSSAQPQGANGSMQTGSFFRQHFCDKDSRAQHEAAAAHGVSDSEYDQFNGFTPTPPTQPLQEPFAPESPEFMAPAQAGAQVGDSRTILRDLIRD
jgi:hypothetical protein